MTTPPPLLKKQSTILSDILLQNAGKTDEYSVAVDFAYKICHIWSERHPDRARELCDPNMKVKSLGEEFGVDKFIQLSHAFHDMLEDLRVEIKEVFLNGTMKDGKVCIIANLSGNWKNSVVIGPTTLMAPARRISFDSTYIFTVKNGKAILFENRTDFTGVPELYAFNNKKN